jgi:hypothetical protein
MEVELYFFVEVIGDHDCVNHKNGLWDVLMEFGYMEWDEKWSHQERKNKV